MRGVLIVIAMVLLFLAAPAWAQTVITPGAVTVTSTFESLSVTAPFTGDANANATVAVQFRVTGSGAFKNAYPPFIDRRATIAGRANPFANQARGAIVGLVANTSYDVQVTWTDPDGVTGGQPALVTISTLSHSPPTGSGTTRNITDNASQSSALAAANPGDTLVWAAGSYAAFTVSRSGNSGAWIVLDGGGVATVSGLGTTQNIALNANFIILKNFILSASDFHGITVRNGQHDIRVTGNIVQGFSRLCANGPNCNAGGAHCEDAGIKVGDFGSVDHVYVLNNTVTGHPNLVGCLQSPSWDGPGTGIQMFTCTTCVFADNKIVGNGARDALSQDSQANPLTNVDIARNTVSGYVDDGIEFKGSNLNVRAWGNIITENGTASVGGSTCMSNEYTDSGPASNPYGPSYYFRNTCKIVRSAGGCGFKGPSGPLFAFHNSMDGTGVAGNADWAMNCGTSSVGSGPYWIFNNATVVEAQMLDATPSGAVTTDYNCGIAHGTYASNWNNSTTYNTFADFQGTGQEAHGINANPGFVDSALHIGATSPCIGKGVVLPNFNSLDSAWPYSGTAPDIGAFEVGVATSRPEVPTVLTVK